MLIVLFIVKCRWFFKLHITTCAENGKIQLTPKITNHLLTCYLNCMCKSNPVCLIQQWSVIFLLASYVQWHYILVWAYENEPIDFSPSMFTLKGYAVQCFTSSNEWIHFCATIQTYLLAYEFLRRSKSTLQYKSKQPHAPLRSHKVGFTSVDLFPKSAVLQPVPLKMRLDMVIGMQNEILIGIKKLPFYVSFQTFKGKETWKNSFVISIRISFCIPMTISSLTPVAGLNLLTEKVSRFSELSSAFEFRESFSSNVKVNPVFSWKGQNSFQRIFPPCSQNFTTPQISFEFSGFYYTSNSFLIKPINTNDRKTCPFREILSQRIGRGEDRVE